MDNVLSIITFLPGVAAAILALFSRGDDAAAQRNAKWLALIASTLTFLISLFVYFQFDPADTGFQFVEEYDWILGLTYKMGIDGISVLLLLLTTFLMPITIAACWTVETRVKEYMIAFLLLETLMLGVFCALDLVLFYLFFEAGLIPMFLIIGIWGGKDRIYAAFKFFLYTFLGSVLMLVAMVAMYVDAGTTDMAVLLQHTFPSDTLHFLGLSIPGGFQTLLFLAFFASFAVKMPMWPVHTWLPDAHVQAPTAGSVILAAVLLKMGGLRVPALQRADVPGGDRGHGRLLPVALGHRHRLHLFRGARAGGHEEVDRLLVGGAYGLCHHGHLRGEPAGHRRRDVPDDLARADLGRVVRLRRRGL